MTAIAITAPSTARTSLLCLAAASPLWASVSIAQAATREGYDITRHPFSILSNGSLGWIQITNFVVTGVLLLAGVPGLRRALPDGRGSTWLPRLITAAGFGLIGAGVFVMDPGAGFPVGTPEGTPMSLSWHSYGHMVAGTITFASLIAACFILGRRFRGWASVTAWISGAALLVGDLWAMSGGTAGSLTLAIGAIAAMLYVSWTATRLRRKA